MTNKQIIFYLNNECIRYTPDRTYISLLEFLRLNRELTGTKEGCGEGDCGACTVLIGSVRKTKDSLKLIYQSVNSCITFLPTIHACHVISVEHISKEGEVLHPIQKELKNSNGVQCGFCTPGIVMSLYNMFLNNSSVDKPKIEENLQGNLCRCTGYRPIVTAAKKVFEDHKRENDPLIVENLEMAEKLIKIKNNEPFPYCTPKDLKSMMSLMKTKPKFTMIAGSTDIGVSINKDQKIPPNPIYLSHVEELKCITRRKKFVIVGAGVTYTEFIKSLKYDYPELTGYLSRVGGEQIRNMGTVGGNMVTASPIGDLLPPLIAMKADVVISDFNSNLRILPVEKFFVRYKTTQLRNNEFILHLKVPYPEKGHILSNYKISKRRDEDITSVSASFYFVIKNKCIFDVRLAFGGMDEIPRRAENTESFLLGRTWNKKSVLKAIDQIEIDFNPISDFRASKSYRLLVAKNLLKRFFIKEFEGHNGLSRNGNLLMS